MQSWRLAGASARSNKCARLIQKGSRVRLTIRQETWPYVQIARGRVVRMRGNFAYIEVKGLSGLVRREVGDLLELAD